MQGDSPSNPMASGAGEGADDETNNSKFAKRTWNVPWNQQFHFLASHFSIADWMRWERVAQDSPLKSCGFSRFSSGLKCRKSEMRDLRYISHGAQQPWPQPTAVATGRLRLQGDDWCRRRR